MSGDALGSEGPRVDAELYRARREQAARFWRSLPAESFDMTHWGCGNAACALGWLAAEGLNGWAWSRAGGTGVASGIPALAIGLKAYMAAAYHFGLTIQEAQSCFGPSHATAGRHGRWFARRVKPDDVARTLLAMPYTEQPDCHALR